MVLANYVLARGPHRRNIAEAMQAALALTNLTDIISGKDYVKISTFK
jgi:hypothetical protein